MSDLSDLAPDYQAIKARHLGPNGTARPLGQIELVRFSDMQPQIEDKAIVGGMLEGGGFSLIVGASGASKTFLAVHLAVCVASGAPFFGCPTRPTGVVYIAAEAGRGIVNRIVAYRQAFTDMPQDLPLAAIISPVNLRESGAGIDTLINEIEAADLSAPIGLVIVDTLSRALGGGDENSSADMGDLVLNLDTLRSVTKAHVALVHHLGKDATRGARGHSLLHAAVDTEISVVYDAAVKRSTATITKQREMPTTGAFVYSLRVIELGRNQFDEAVTSCILQIETAEAQSARPTKLSPKNRIAFDLLRKAVAEMGKPPPASNHIPDGVHAVSVDDWRRYFYTGTASDGGSEAARIKAFQRARTDLQAAQVIGLWNDLVWAIGQ